MVLLMAVVMSVVMMVHGIIDGDDASGNDGAW